MWKRIGRGKGVTSLLLSTLEFKVNGWTVEWTVKSQFNDFQGVWWTAFLENLSKQVTLHLWMGIDNIRFSEVKFAASCKWSEWILMKIWPTKEWLELHPLTPSPKHHPSTHQPATAHQPFHPLKIQLTNNKPYFNYYQKLGYLFKRQKMHCWYCTWSTMLYTFSKDSVSLLFLQSVAIEEWHLWWRRTVTMTWQLSLREGWQQKDKM